MDAFFPPKQLQTCTGVVNDVHIGQLLVVRIYEIIHIQRMKRYELVRN